MSNCGNGDFDSKYGTVTIRFPGRREAPPNLQTLKRVKGREALPGYKYSASAGDVVLQGPALRAFRQAELRATPRRLKRKGLIQPILITGVGYRSYALQSSLVAEYGIGRFADPDCSLHCEALAIDDNNNLSLLRKTVVRRALKAEGFTFGVSGEPWHSSFRVVG